MPRLVEEGSLRPHKVILVAAAVLLGAGLLLLYESQFPRPLSVQGAETFQIPDGHGWHSFFRLELLEGGGVTVEFTEGGDGTVDVFLLDDEDYGIYQDSGLVLRPLGSASGSAGTFMAEVPSEGTYYLVFTHGSVSQALSQDVQITYLFEGLRPLGPDRDQARLGFLLLLVGAAAANVGGFLKFRLRSRAVSDAET